MKQAAYFEFPSNILVEKDAVRKLPLAEPMSVVALFSFCRR
jgi:hypothetical protein